MNEGDPVATKMNSHRTWPSCDLGAVQEADWPAEEALFSDWFDGVAGEAEGDGELDRSSCGEESLLARSRLLCGPGR